MTYPKEQLKDPRWQKKRLEILDRDKFTCQFCLSVENTLHVHHKNYKKGASLWEYQNDNFLTLCDSCHISHEYTLKRKNVLISNLKNKHLHIPKNCLACGNTDRSNYLPYRYYCISCGWEKSYVDFNEDIKEKKYNG